MTRLRRRMLAIAALAAAAVACLLTLTDVGRRLELSTVDSRFELRGKQPVPRDIVLVAIDDKTFDRDEYGRGFPFSRNFHADVIEQVSQGQPRVIVYDVQFTEPSRDRRADNRLFLAAQRAGNVVFSSTETLPDGTSNVFGGVEAQQAAGVTVGSGLFDEDPGGVIRRVQEEINGLDTLAVAAVRRLGRPLDAGALAGDGQWIDYAGPAGHVPRHTFSDVGQGEVDPETFRDKIVVVGATAPVLQDIHPVSWPDDRMPGPEVHANAIATLLDGVPLRGTPEGVDLALALALALLGPLAALLRRAWLALLIMVAAGILYLVVAQLLFGAGWIVPVVAPIATLAVGLVGTLLVFWLTATFERARTRDVFARFVPDTVVDQVLTRATEEGDPRLGGERMDATVMFSDLRGFTSFAEARPPEQVIEILNRYLTAMSDAILDHGGTLVAYMGDGIMAVFGAPVAAGDHPDRALAAARAMLERLDDFNAWMREGELGDGFKMGIGLHSGPVMSGNVGSARRLEYAAIGDTTNTAARLEAMTKGTPYQLYVGDSTRERLTAPTEDLERVGELDVRGREHAISVWGLRA
ncbi:MAG TPA: adenylate/guanylate cyclase domain-containing protein [Solirubrobacteraceae bacterium]|nr:adenylate/guanylate cyclase domain-containing protein [Solirubrobacteraceae bacterium]